MNSVEKLLQYAEDHHIEVVSRPLAGKPAISLEHEDHAFIAIDFDRIESSARQAVVLAHELGHVESGTFNTKGDLFPSPGKNEFKANKRSILRLLPRDDLMTAGENCGWRLWEVAEEMGVTQDLMCDDLFELLSDTQEDDREGYVFLSAKGKQLSHSAIERGMDGYFYMLERYINGEDVTKLQTGRPHRHDLSRAKSEKQRLQWEAHNRKVDEWEATRKKIRFVPYDLRHTFSTAMYDAGVDVKTAAYFMGHKDIETTLRIYTHLSEERSRRGAAAMVDFLNSWKPLALNATKWPEDGPPTTSPDPGGQPFDNPLRTSFILTGSKRGQNTIWACDGQSAI